MWKIRRYELVVVRSDGKSSFDGTRLAGGSISLTSSRKGTPSTLTFSIKNSSDISFNEGDTVRFSCDGKEAFRGRVFEKRRDRMQNIEVVCHDPIRYLKNRSTGVFEGMTASEIAVALIRENELVYGEIEDTGFKIPSLVFENKSAIDIILSALDITLLETGGLYRLFADGGKISLHKSGKNPVRILRPENILDYSYVSTVDRGSASLVAAVVPGKCGAPDYRTTLSSSTFASQIGLLSNSALVSDRESADRKAATLLALYGKVMRELTVTALIPSPVYGGEAVYVGIPSLGEIDLSDILTVESSVCRFTPSGIVAKLNLVMP